VPHERRDCPVPHQCDTQIVSADPEPSSVPLVLPELGRSRHPLIPDANALIEDIVHYARRQQATGRGYSRLTLLTGIGVARAFVPAHIPDKVDVHLERAAEDCDLDVELAYEIWNTVLRPLLTMVDLWAITDTDDPRVLTVPAVDPEDAPVAQLAVMLAPALLLTRDRHLLDAGLGAAKWADALGLVQQIAAADSMVNSTVTLTAVSVWGAGLALKHAGRVLARSPILIGVALAVIFMLLTDWRDSTQPRLAKTGAGAKRAGRPVLDELADQCVRRHVADMQLRALLVNPGEPGDISRVARALAVGSAATRVTN
jgi:hypothetical protein